MGFGGPKVGDMFDDSEIRNPPTILLKRSLRKFNIAPEKLPSQ